MCVCVSFLCCQSVPLHAMCILKWVLIGVPCPPTCICSDCGSGYSSLCLCADVGCRQCAINGLDGIMCYAQYWQIYRMHTLESLLENQSLCIAVG